MGQAWCKERTTKAQDSKSPLDRVFVRCAHQIYPTLKQDGSVLGGATQRVTSSEIGYAGSPPREALTRGESVDSIDRPFHPSEWVDVNLEVPSTPSSVITNQTANTSLYQTTTLSSSIGSNLKNITPIPPPRKRKKNRGRPLPPKPDEIIETHGKVKSVKKIEPIYSSVQSTRIKERLVNEKSNNNDYDENKENKNNEKKENPRKVLHEQKVNGTGRILAINEVTEGDRWTNGDPREVRNQNAHHDEKRYHDHKNKNKKEEEEDENEDEGAQEGNNKRNNQELEYEKFSKIQELRNSSTPKGLAKNSGRESTPGKDLCEFVSRTIMDDDDILDVVHHRPKNYSTISLPNYDELEVVKKEVERDTEDAGEPGSKIVKKKRNISTTSLPPAELLASLPEGTTERLGEYMTRCRSFGSLQPHEILDKLKAHGEQIDSSDEDEWGGLDDWDLGVFDHSGPSDGRSPLEPSSRLRERKNNAIPKFNIGGDDLLTTKKEESTVGVTEKLNLNDKDNETGKKNESESPESGKTTLPIPRNASFEIPKSPNSLKSALKAEANRKISMPAKFSSDKPNSPLEEWFSGQERSVRFFDVPKLEEEYANTPGHRPAKPSDIKKTELEYDMRSYPFNGLPTGSVDIDTFFNPPTGSSVPLGGRQERAKNLTRSLSNESEPFDGYEEKELTLEIRSQPSSIGKLSRTISDESIPAEMDAEGDDLLSGNISAEDQKAKSKDLKTPPPSPEPKIHAEILDNDHFSGARSTGLKVQRDDEGEESNLSSMTPSLTELEAALSDMLEKEDHDEAARPDHHNVEDSENSNLSHSELTGQSLDKPIEPKIVPKSIDREMKEDLNNHDTSNLLVRRRKENVKISLGQILNDGIQVLGNSKTESISSKVPEKLSQEIKTAESFLKAGEFKEDKIVGRNPFEDIDDEEEEEDRDNEYEKEFRISKFTSFGSRPAGSINPFDGGAEPPEKPSRLHKVPLDQNSSQETTPDIPTPPQRKNKQGAAISPTTKSAASTNGDSQFPIRDSTPHPNDRLI